MRKLLRITIIMLMVCMIVKTFTFQVKAQDSGTPVLKIESVSVENLPEVTVLVQGKNLNGTLNELPINLHEDGVEREILSQSVIEKGLHIALVVDPTLDLTSIGKSGDAMQFEIANGASSLIQSGILSVQTDWLAAFAISGNPAQFMQLNEEWQRDHQRVVNTLYQYQPVEAEDQDGLANVLNDVMEAMLNAPVPVGVQRTIVLFSDGSVLPDNSAINETILNAQKYGISIQMVLMGDGDTLARHNLVDLSAATGGNFAEYDDSSSLAPIWQKLDDDSRFQKLTYRLGSANPEQVAVSVSFGVDESVVATEDFPEILLKPVQISIKSPLENEEIVRSISNFETDLSKLEPRNFPVEIEFTWPDGVQREIEAVEYKLDGFVSTLEKGPFTSYDLSILDLDQGSYTLDVKAIDEYGISGDAESVSINVEIDMSVVSTGAGNDGDSASTLSSNISSSNIATTSEVIQLDASNQGMNILGLQLPETIDIFGVTFLVNGITLLIALFPIIFLLALFLYWLTQRNEQPAEQDYGYYEYDNNGYFYRFEPSTDDMQLTQPQVSVIEPEEDLTMPVKLPSFYTNAAAYLIYVSGGEHLPKKIPVETSEPVRIGRKKSFCDQILDDQRVSRLHSVITYEGGNFYIKDEGSSGGTFVNRRKLGPTDKQLLKHNDIVNFNEVEYRIEVAEPDSIDNANGELTYAEASNDAESMMS